MVCDHPGAATQVSRLVFMNPRKNKMHTEQIPCPGGGCGTAGKSDGSYQHFDCRYAHVHTHSFQKDLGNTLNINHPSNRPHLLLSTPSELFTRQTAPQERASRLTGSTHPASGSVCVCVECVSVSVPRGRTGVTSQTKAPPAV